MTPEAISRARFWARVTKTATCWTITTKRPEGYATFGDRTAPWTNGEIYAHRIVWRDVNGGAVVPPGYEVDHICKVRNCVRPSHLRCITLAHNRIGREYKNGGGRGKLTDDQVREIRKLLSLGHGQNEIARKFGIHQGSVRMILVGQSYKHVI